MLTATFFLALLTLDERRRARRALDCMCCCLTYPAPADALATAQNVSTGGGAKGGEGGESKASDDTQPEGRSGRGGGQHGHSRARRALGGYARAVTHPVMAALITVIFVGLIPLGFGGAIQALKMGVDFEDYFPDGSYYSNYYMASRAECARRSYPYASAPSPPVPRPTYP